MTGDDAEQLSTSERLKLIYRIVARSHDKARALHTLTRGFHSAMPRKFLELINKLTHRGHVLFRGVRADPKSDEPEFIYSYGASIFAGYDCEIFTLDTDISQSDLNVLLDNMRKTGNLFSHVPRSLEAFCTTCLNKNMYVYIRLVPEARKLFERTMAPQLTLKPTTPILAVIRANDTEQLYRNYFALFRLGLATDEPPILKDCPDCRRDT